MEVAAAHISIPTIFNFELFTTFGFQFQGEARRRWRIFLPREKNSSQQPWTFIFFFFWMWQLALTLQIYCWERLTKKQLEICHESNQQLLTPPWLCPVLSQGTGRNLNSVKNIQREILLCFLCQSCRHIDCKEQRKCFFLMYVLFSLRMLAIAWIIS